MKAQKMIKVYESSDILVMGCLPYLFWPSFVLASIFILFIGSTSVGFFICIPLLCIMIPGAITMNLWQKEKLDIDTRASKKMAAQEEYYEKRIQNCYETIEELRSQSPSEELKTARQNCSFLEERLISEAQKSVAVQRRLSELQGNFHILAKDLREKGNSVILLSKEVNKLNKKIEKKNLIIKSINSEKRELNNIIRNLKKQIPDVDDGEFSESEVSVEEQERRFREISSKRLEQRLNKRRD